ncbi:hypothetical protein J6590_047393 [Homalodisca vitripennis]|nr:hypothetical protein J6590_047393 [Homalodisca vitripennis]
MHNTPLLPFSQELCPGAFLSYTIMDLRSFSPTAPLETELLFQMLVDTVLYPIHTFSPTFRNKLSNYCCSYGPVPNWCRIQHHRDNIYGSNQK